MNQLDIDHSPSLHSMVIQSHDTLRGQEIDLSIPPGWRDRPPLIEGPRGQPETPNLLKGLIRKGIPPPLRCAIWLSNVMQAVYPHQESKEWHEYRTLAKVRALDHAYDSVAHNAEPSNGGLESTTSTGAFGQQDPAVIEGITPEGFHAQERVLSALEQILGIDYVPAIPTIVQILLTTMAESYAFMAVREMTHATQHFFPVSRTEYLATERAFVDIFYKLHPATAEYLNDRGIFDDLKPIFQDFYLDVLPLRCVLRIMDVYTLEGMKVLFRVGVSLFVLFKLEAAREIITISNAEEFWSNLKKWTHDSRFNFDGVMRKAYGIHGRVLRRQLRFPSRNIIHRIIRLEEERLRLEGVGDEAYVAPAKPIGLSDDIEIMDREPVTPVLGQDVAFRTKLAEWIPLALRLTSLRLLYSTNYHGRSLEMFYKHVTKAKHTISLIEVFNEDKSTAIIGMYASQNWRPSTQVYGDGNCFLFRLKPEPRCWKWSPGKKSLSLEDYANDQEVALLEQFMVSTHSYISMGGNRDGTCGLRLNEDFTVGESSTAEGFKNEPLHGKDKNSVFQVGLVEVYGLVRQIDGRAA